MHTLIILTALLSSLPAEWAPADPRASLSQRASTPLQLRGTPSTAFPALKAPRFNPLETLGNDQSSDRAANRVFLEFLVGSGLGILGGGLTGLAMGSNIESPASLVLPMSILLLGSSLGVSLVGGMMEGRGRFGYALLGSIIGSAPPLFIGMGLIQFVNCRGPGSDGCAKPVVVSLLGLLVLPAVGAIVGYELSAPKSWLLLARAPGKLPAPRQVVPVVTLARQGLGGTVGFAWTL